MYYTIYKTTNLLNNKYYIGKHQTCNLDDGYMGSGKYLWQAIKKYGIEHFKKEILFIFDTEEEMNAKERELVIISEETYNLCDGGQGGFSYINRNKLNNTNKDRVEISRKISNSLQGKHWPHMSEVNKKRHNDGVLEHTYFGNRINDKEIRELSRSPEAIRKRKETYKKNTHQQGNKNSQYGKMWIYNTELQISRSVSKDSTIPDGWLKGRKIFKKI